MSAAAAGVPPLCGVVGGGRMGAGIAHVLVRAGSRVVVVESSDELADAARGRVEASLQTAEQRGSLPGGAAAALERLEVVTGFDGLAGADLVVEAVPEDLGLKHDVLRRVEPLLPASSVLATNTSSLSIDRLAEVLDRPERFVGLHFFNPVPASQLVEVVRGAATADDVVAMGRELAAGLGLEPVVVRDSPGFATSRLGVLLGLEAARMVEEGVAAPEDIDRAMVLGYKHPVGPLRLTDIVGLDVRLGIAEYLSQELGERFAPPQLLRDMVARGDLGRKSGRGFYAW